MAELESQIVTRPTREMLVNYHRLPLPDSFVLPLLHMIEHVAPSFRYAESEIPVDESHSTLGGAIADLHSKNLINNPNHHSLIVLDWDKCARHQSVRNFPFSLGRVTPIEVTLLEQIRDMDQTSLLVVTSQPGHSNHPIGELIGKFRGYETYPKVLNNRDIPHLGETFPFLWLIPYKSRLKSVRQASNFIDKLNQKHPIDHLIGIGDQFGDCVFLERVHQHLSETVPQYHAQPQAYWLRH